MILLQRRQLTALCLVSQEQTGELEMTAFVLHDLEDKRLTDALKVTSDDVAELRSLLRDDHHGICLVIRLLYRNGGAPRHTAQRCRSVDTILHNRIAVKRVVADLLVELQVMLSHPQL